MSNEGTVDKAVYDSLRPLESNWEHYKREVESLTNLLAMEHTRHQSERQRIEEAIDESIRRRDYCYAALKAARQAVESKKKEEA